MFRPDIDTPKRVKSNSVTFTEFLQFILTVKPADGHWNSFERECSPCAIEYDFIGKIETMNKDLQFILDHIGVNLTLPTTQERRYERSKSSYFAEVPEHIIQGLWNLYKNDYEMFGYNFTLPH